MKKGTVLIIIFSGILLCACVPREVTEEDRNLFVSPAELREIGFALPQDYDKNIKIDKTVNFDETYSMNCEYEGSLEKNLLYMNQIILVEENDFTASLFSKLAETIVHKVLENKSCTIKDCGFKISFGDETKIYKIMDDNDIQLGNIISLSFGKVKYSMIVLGFLSLDEEKIHKMFDKRALSFEALNKSKRWPF